MISVLETYIKRALDLSHLDEHCLVFLCIFSIAAARVTNFCV
jgi:hypothetical protein